MEPAAGRHPRPGLHPVWLLLLDHEASSTRFSLCTRYVYALYMLVSPLTCCQTGWGTRAGIGDPTAATAAAARA